MAWLKAFTEFGDPAVLMPMTMGMLLWLVLTRSARGGAWWAIAVVFCTRLTAVLQVVFYACPTPDLHSPSGHTTRQRMQGGTQRSKPEMRGLNTHRRGGRAWDRPAYFRTGGIRDRYFLNSARSSKTSSRAVLLEAISATVRAPSMLE
jgi:hypothetical protein